MAKTWHLLAHDRAAIEELSQSLRLSPVVAQLLINRGLSDPVRARRFLDAPLTDLHPPGLLHGAVEAAERLHRAAAAGRRICIYGDYDTDGITGTAILWHALRLVGASVDFYLPHRMEEGYGLNRDALGQIARSGASLVVTVDCGIAGLEEAKEARRLGLELIVTDHHELKAELPEADVVVHPRHPAGAYPFGGISGAGVAFKVAWALSQKACGSDKVTPRFRELLLDGVGLAALGLVADVVPLHEENRVFVRHGLARLRKCPSPGIKALLDSAGLTDKGTLTAEDVGYRLAPRLNAVGRLGAARLVVDLLTTASEQRAADLARYLDEQNRQRQQLERRIAAQARDLLASQDLDQQPGIVLASADWHPGVIGIVAGRLAEEFARPVLLVALVSKSNGDGPVVVGHGSGRSVPGFALHQALQDCDDLLLSHGGHAAAAGLKVLPEQIDTLRDRFGDCAARHFPAGPTNPRLVIDAEVPLAALTSGLLRDIDRLEPYGSGNRRPLFLSGGLQVVGEPKSIGGGERHLSFRVRQQGTTMRAIAFNLAERCEELMASAGQCSLVFTPRVNEWQGFRRIDLEVHDFQAGPRAKLG